MRKIIYQCDECEKVLSDGKIAKPHLSVEFASYSGWVSRHPQSGWRHDDTVSGRKQFCNGVCLGRYFRKNKYNAERLAEIKKQMLKKGYAKRT